MVLIKTFQQKLAITILGLCLLSVACVKSDADRLADEIEETVILPARSNSLNSYARYYFQGADGIIHDSYIIHPKNFRKSVRGEYIQQNIKSYPCNQADVGIIGAGDRSWVTDRRNLPFKNGGGCSYLYFTYDSKRSKMTSIECSGSY